MTLWSVLLSILWLVIIPVVVGASFGFGQKLWEKAVWSWLFGQLFLWSVFQAIAVFEVSKGNSFLELKKYYLYFDIKNSVFLISLSDTKANDHIIGLGL